MRAILAFLLSHNILFAQGDLCPHPWLSTVPEPRDCLVLTRQNSTKGLDPDVIRILPRKGRFEVFMAESKWRSWSVAQAECVARGQTLGAVGNLFTIKDRFENVELRYWGTIPNIGTWIGLHVPDGVQHSRSNFVWIGEPVASRVANQYYQGWASGECRRNA